jgi:D-alanyl-D-alanine carboxypeptidase/D-alanyl-D-alanine-endopeptidase (penicillin-binding protein 4)
LLELFSSGLVSLWLNLAKVSDPLQSMANLVPGLDTPWFVGSGAPDLGTQAVVQQYLQGLTAKGLTKSLQGIWIQSGSVFLASNQGTTPLPAASVTKVATSLASLQTWDPDHQFETLISATGPIQNGVLQGDLVVQGGGDPLFVWEEAIALGNDLNQMGISKITGNLIITGNFLMDFETQPEKAGEMLKQALDSQHWSSDVEAQYQALPNRIHRPQLAIAGSVQVLTYGADSLPGQILLVRHHSLPLKQILKLMNIYSNNVVAESLANSVGGAGVVAQRASEAAGVPPTEISLINGSGLGMQNQISPRAACAMFATLQRYLLAHNLTIADIFPISGIDEGSIEGRKIPAAAVVKTGTLNQVSALAGVVPTRDRGLIWFAIMNRGTDLDGLRHQQDVLLQTLVNQWGMVSSSPLAIAPTYPLHEASKVLGDTRRNQVLGAGTTGNIYGGN